jgi:membrane-bound serine protease (ClpP class)
MDGLHVRVIPAAPASRPGGVRRLPAPGSTRPGSRRPVAGLLLVALGFLLLLVAPSVAAGAAADGPGDVRVLTLDGMINPVSQRYLERGIEAAAAEGAELVVIELDTPGGLLDATQELTSGMLGSRVPIAVYVTPQGARAASAGVFVTMAAHVAAMAPGTRIGAATPVSAEGEEMADDLRTKVINDTVVYGRTIAEARGRNADWAEDAVRDAVVVSAREAVELGVVDLIAEDRAALLAAIDGTTVELPEGPVTLQTASAPVVGVEMSPVESLFMAIANPTIALLLLSLGALGVYAELTNPGTLLPGIAGVILLVLAFLSLGMLPLSMGGLALVVIGLLLIGAEPFVASGGVLGVGGVAAFVIGALLLVDDTRAPFVEVSLPVILALGAGMGAFVLIALQGMARVRGRPAAIGPDDLVGRFGRMRGVGEVFVAGERWAAVGPDPDAPLPPPNAPVRIARREGFRLVVEPADPAEADAAGLPPSPKE